MTDVGRRVAVGVLVWALVLVGVRVTLASAERCREVTVGELRTSAGEAVGWFERNLGDDGRWVYAYERGSGDVDPTYNIVRHSGVALSLAQAAGAEIEGALPVLEAGLEYSFDHLVEAGDGLAFGFEGRHLELGASALLVNALVERRIVTRDESHDDTLRAVGRFIAGQVEPDGQMLAAWDPDTGAPVPGVTSQYFTGESFWALARLHTAFPGEGWDASTRRVARYVAEERDDREPRYPPVSDHWTGYAYGEIVHWPDGGELTDADRRYAERLAGVFGVQTRFESQKNDALTDLTHGGDVLASGVGTWGEGLGGLWRAGAVDAELAAIRTEVAERAECVASILVDRQVSVIEATSDVRPDIARGAWFADGRTQMDDQQHALSALLAAIPMIEERS